MWKGSDVKKTKRRGKKRINQIDSKQRGYADRKLNKWAEEVQKPEDTADLIKQYEDLIRTEKKGIINIAFHQGMVFKKFKDKEKFPTLVNKLGIHKTTITFKINIFKLCKK